MKKHPAREFTWFTEDEGLLHALAAVRHPDGERRHYDVLEADGKKVFVKSFSEKGVAGRIRQKVAPRGKKEFTIARGLRALGIRAPLALGYGTGDLVSAVAESFIDGKSLLEHIKEGTGREDLLGRLADLLLSLRNRKVRHDDLHLDNILVSGDNLYLVDLHKVRLKKSFSNEDEVTNLTHALGIIYNDITKHERDIFFDRYGCTAETREKVENAIERLRARWIIKKMERAFRDTSVVIRKGNDIFIRGMEDRAKGGYEATIKEDRKIKVERFSDHVKKTYAGRARLKRAWENHVVLEYLHMPVAPKAFHARLPSGEGKGYISMEDLQGKGEELDRFLDRRYDSMHRGERKDFIDSLAAFFLGAMTWGITHRDLKACNIFVVASGGFRLLDVEDIRFEKVTGDVLKRTFLQLCNTIPKRISTRDRMRFFLRLSALINTDKKRLMREVLAGSLKEPIVYEGVSGLIVDKW